MTDDLRFASLLGVVEGLCQAGVWEAELCPKMGMEGLL